MTNIVVLVETQNLYSTIFIQFLVVLVETQNLYSAILGIF
jgi:hypothetical protein